MLTKLPDDYNTKIREYFRFLTEMWRDTGAKTYIVQGTENGKCYVLAVNLETPPVLHTVLFGNIPIHDWQKLHDMGRDTWVASGVNLKFNLEDPRYPIGYYGKSYPLVTVELKELAYRVMKEEIF